MTKYTKEFCVDFCKDLPSKAELVRKNEYVYKVMAKRGWLTEVFSDKVVRPEKWSYEDLKSEALKYQTRNSFKWGSWNAYHVVARRGLLDDLCSHMKTISKTDADVVYLLENTELIPGQKLYKVGITSKRCQKRRLAELKYSTKTAFRVVMWVESEDASEMEKQLLSFGSQVKVPNFRGYKEIRMFNEQELETVVDLLKQAGGV